MSARSDLWRVQRNEDKARETAYVCMAIADYLRIVAKDRDYVVAWRDGTDGDGAPDGATDTRAKRVSLNRGLVNGQRAPFPGTVVDHLTGVAAHEAGHALIASDGWRFDPNQYSDPHLAHAIDNYIEDMLIDGASMRAHNRGIGELTERMRLIMRDGQRPLALKLWEADSGILSPFVLANLWAVAHLCRFRDSLAPLPHRQQETRTLIELDRIAVDVMHDATGLGQLDTIHWRILNWISAVYQILMGYDSDTKEQRQQQQQEREQRQQEREQQREQRRREREQQQQEQQQQQEDEDADSDSDSDSDSTDADTDSSDSGAGDADGDADEDDEADDSDSSDSSDSGSDAGTEADADSDEDADGDASGDSDSSSGDSDSSSDSSEPQAGEPDEDDDSSSSGDDGAPGTGHGDGTAEDADEDEDVSEPDPNVAPNVACPNDADSATDSDEDARFWNDVQREYDRLFALDFYKRGQRDGARVLSKFTDKRTLEAIRRAYERMASEPDRRRHLESGRIDRKRIAYSEARSDIFRRQTARQVSGTLALLLDFSGSTAHAPIEGSIYDYEDCQPLIRRVTASVYAALQRTEINVYAFAFSKGGCNIDGQRRAGSSVTQLASPDRVIDFDRVAGDGYTNTDEAIEVARTQIKPRGDSAMIIVTDGRPDSMFDTVDRIKAARRDGWRVMLMLVGNIGGSVDEMINVSDSSVQIRNYHDLAGGMAKLIDGIMRGQARRQ